VFRHQNGDSRTEYLMSEIGTMNFGQTEREEHDGQTAG